MPTASSIAIAMRKTGVARTMICAGVISADHSEQDCSDSSVATISLRSRPLERYFNPDARSHSAPFALAGAEPCPVERLLHSAHEDARQTRGHTRNSHNATYVVDEELKFTRVVIGLAIEVGIGDRYRRLRTGRNRERSAREVHNLSIARRIGKRSR